MQTVYASRAAVHHQTPVQGAQPGRAHGSASRPGYLSLHSNCKGAREATAKPFSTDFLNFSRSKAEGETEDPPNPQTRLSTGTGTWTPRIPPLKPGMAPACPAQLHPPWPGRFCKDLLCFLSSTPTPTPALRKSLPPTHCTQVYYIRSSPFWPPLLERPH